MDLALQQFQKAVPIRPVDNLRVKGYSAIVPSHNEEAPTNMYKILSHEYQREWFKERNEKYQQIANLEKLKAELLSRRVLKKHCRPLVPQKPFMLKRFANVLGKVDTNLGIPHAN